MKNEEGKEEKTWRRKIYFFCRGEGRGGKRLEKENVLSEEKTNRE